MDSGSTESFLSSKVVSALSLSVTPTSETISMASTAHIGLTSGRCTVSVSLNGRRYEDISFLVLPNLCSDVLLGQDFMDMHDCVSFHFGGPLPGLSICGVTATTLQPTSLFANLTPDCKPVKTPSRRYSAADQEFIKSEMDQMLRDGIIEPSNSPWRSQVHITTGDRHKKRLVVDYSQTINRFTLLDAYPLPRIDDLVGKVSQYKVFSALDLKSAYLQVAILPEDRPFTAFEADGRLLQFTRLPPGLTNAVSCFQRTIHNFIKDNNLDATFAYLDDVLVCGMNTEEHDRNLKRFVDAAKQSNLTMNEEKCKIRQTEINFIGYTISNGTLCPDAQRLEPLRNLPEPQDTASLRRCTGLFSYYSQWIPRYSDKIEPLLHCNTFPLNAAAKLSFENLKLEIENAVVQSINEDIPFVVETDASDVALAATLSQGGKPVAFFSRTLSATERHHPSIEKEAATIVEATRKWRHFLCGRHFRLITDQQSVSFMFSSRNYGKIKNDKITRWRIELSEFSYDIIYRPGDRNVSADALSRVCGAAAGTSTYDEL